MVRRLVLLFVWFSPNRFELVDLELTEGGWAAFDLFVRVRRGRPGSKSEKHFTTIGWHYFFALPRMSSISSTNFALF